MLKDKTAYEMNRSRYVEAGRKLAEEKANKRKFIKAVHTGKLH